MEAGERRVEAFAVFNVFYQLGILVGPLLGLALLTVDFRLVCTTAAVVFLALTLLQAKALPGRTSDPAGLGAAARSGPTGSIVRSWRTVVANRPFLLFSLAVIGSYVLTFQIYLGLPMEVRRVTGEETGVMLLFALPGLLTVVGQVRLTAWATARWTPAKAISRGLAVMGLSFLPLAVAVSVGGDRDASPDGPSLLLLAHVWALAPALAAALALAVGTMIVYPFEMATIVTLSGDRMIGTYYGLYTRCPGLASPPATCLPEQLSIPAAPRACPPFPGSCSRSPVAAAHSLSPGSTGPGGWLRNERARRQIQAQRPPPRHLNSPNRSAQPRPRTTRRRVPSNSGRRCHRTRHRPRWIDNASLFALCRSHSHHPYYYLL